jgi:hypothetical protein
MNDEFEMSLKEAVVGNSGYYSGNFPEGLSKITNNFGQDNCCPRPRFDPRTSQLQV